jgi:hypothetical protein
VIARAETEVLKDVVELEYAVDVVGVNSAVNVAAPRSTGTQAQVAVVDAAKTDPQPAIDDPSNLKFTVPAREVVAVMVFEMRYCGDADANASDTVVDAYPIEIVKLDVEAVAEFTSVTVTDTVEEPASVGVPEIVPVEVLKLRPSTNVPVKEYVNAARPPAAGTDKEKALSAVPNRPVIGVAMVNEPATVKVAVVEVLEVATPLPMVLVTTDV